ncbi:peptidylprolyl isomerase [Prosthecobacter vanneervenii]|uniref:peptidylprolyl isomerase n=1 Tax=Prosthecobacter vanneervenii TaxID=48466 RepID=A0A7W8DKD7_9BACT|nr:peptidylprolyl isomerase [Prosthecobacter vanneervenii]MBB5033108.1 cyclophilin family peptidyl-prolyl cis-trans isomerase [Prosthecobacter vanneervenii]
MDRHVKPLLLTCLLALGCHSALHAQTLNAPQSLRDGIRPAEAKAKDEKDMVAAAPAAAPSTTQEVDKLAEEAQKSLFQSVDKSSSGSAPTTTTFSGPLRLPAQRLEDPSLWAKDSVHKLAVMEVALGGSKETVMIELFPNDAPQTVNNFIDKCDSGFYKGLAFHRAIEGFIVQTGDPLTSDESARTKWGTGGEDKTLPAEIKLPHRIGAVAMARRSDKVNPERRSNGSQFYITLGNYKALEGNYTVFGQVVSGLETIKRISLMPVDANDCPVARIEIKSIKVVNQKGPMQLPTMTAQEGARYVKPDAARSMVGRIFRHIW